MPDILDVKIKLKQLQEQYKNDPESDKMHALILGEKGAGKTHILKTAPKPILVHSFDPGGTVTLKEEIDAGDVFVDKTFERDDPFNPKAYLAWEKEFFSLMKSGFFEGIGTYCLDPLTTLAQLAVWQIAKKEGRVLSGMDRKINDTTQGLRPQDWGTMLMVMSSITRKLATLPCHTITTCHYAREKNRVTGEQMVTVMLPGQSSEQIPLLFAELYVLRSSSNGKRTLLTENDGLYRAGTRMGGRGKFNKVEEPNIKLLLKKAGLNADDKEV